MENMRSGLKLAYALLVVYLCQKIRNTHVERWDPKSDLPLLKRTSSCSFLCQKNLTLVEKNIYTNRLLIYPFYCIWKWGKNVKGWHGKNGDHFLGVSLNNKLIVVSSSLHISDFRHLFDFFASLKFSFEVFQLLLAFLYIFR